MIDTATNPTAAAIHALRAGTCDVCKQTRVEHQSETSAGFGQGMKKDTIFVCGNPQCSNCGKP